MSDSPAQPFESIHGVLTVPLQAFGDDRGRFMETFRKEWFPQVNWDRMQSNRSDSKAGVLRGLHYHFKQIDYWYTTSGNIRIGLVDLRKSSTDIPAIGSHQHGRRQSYRFIHSSRCGAWFRRTDRLHANLHRQQLLRRRQRRIRYRLERPASQY